MLTFFSINYISYTNTYVNVGSDDEIKILYQFSQPTDYVSLSQLMSFGDYMSMINSSSTHQFKSGGEFEVGGTATTILFYIQILGVLVGSLGMALILASSKYCDQCKKYYKNKILKSFDLEKLDTYVENINNTIKNGLSLKKSIEEMQDRDRKLSKYGQIEVSYCPDCHHGYLLINFFAVNSSGESEEIEELRQVLALDQGVVIELAKK